MDLTLNTFRTLNMQNYLKIDCTWPLTTSRLHLLVAGIVLRYNLIHSENVKIDFPTQRFSLLPEILKHMGEHSETIIFFFIVTTLKRSTLFPFNLIAVCIKYKECNLTNSLFSLWMLFIRFTIKIHWGCIKLNHLVLTITWNDRKFYF